MVIAELHYLKHNYRKDPFCWTNWKCVQGTVQNLPHQAKIEVHET